MSVSQVTKRTSRDGDGHGDGEAVRAVVQALLEKNRQLEHALQSRIVIEQAKGVLAERLSLKPDEAFELLRRGARNHRLRVHDLAQRVLDERTTPPEVEAARR